MKIYKVVNTCTKSLEFLVISSVISFYLLSLYDTVTSSCIIIPLYFLLLSLYYYIQLLTKSPGALLDFNHAQIKGLCKKCNRIVGNRTSHCEICNKCYHKRDHHCMITGKCIAANNSRDFFFTLFFLLVYTLLALNRRSQMNEIRFLYKYAGIVSFCLMIWTVCLLLTDKTTNEFFLMKTTMKKEVKYKRIWDLLDGGVVSIIFPLSKKRSRVLL